MPKHPRRVFYAPATFAEDIRTLDKTRKEVALVLGVAIKTVDDYKSGRRRIPKQLADQWQQYKHQQGAM